MAKSIRIRTTPGGSDKYVSVNIEQDFDFLEVLSIKIRQEEVYRQYCADYGVIVGRVILNEGFGAPNCKVSVFIPLAEEDEDNTLITALYPFKSPNDQDNRFVRYNLLPDGTQNGNHKVVGTFPSKRTVLNNDIYLEVYDKYYKFTTRTNTAGDFMIFGVPVGNQTVHFDLDLSDMDNSSLTPQDLIAGGTNEAEFLATDELSTTKYSFKTSTNLDILPQIKSTNMAVNVLPLWGAEDQCIVGITRLDWNVEGLVVPVAIFFGAVMTESGDGNRWSRNGNRPSPPTGIKGNIFGTGGYVSSLGIMNNEPLTGTIEVARLENTISRFYKTEIIDADGNWAFTLPMNNGRVITDENGTLVASTNEDGIPTYGDYRFKLQLDSSNQYADSKNARGIHFAPNYETTNIFAGGGNTTPLSYTLLGAPLTLTSSGINPHDTTIQGQYLDFFYTRPYHYYYRLKAGGIYTILQNNQVPLFFGFGVNTDKNEMPLWSTTAIATADNKVVGIVYFPKFKIGDCYEHGSNLVWGGTDNSRKSFGCPGGGSDKRLIGATHSSPPYYYIHNFPMPINGGDPWSPGDSKMEIPYTLGNLDLKDLTSHFNFFSGDINTLPADMVKSSSKNYDVKFDTACSPAGKKEQLNIGAPQSTGVCYYVYYGIWRAVTALDLVRNTFGV